MGGEFPIYQQRKRELNMAKKKETEEMVDEPLPLEEGQDEAQPSQDAGNGMDIKRLIMFAIIAWFAVGGAFGIVFRDKRNPEDHLEASEQLTSQSPDMLEQSEANTETQLSEGDVTDADSELAFGDEGIDSEPLIVSFENTITNISGTNGRRFLKTRINLEVISTEVEGMVRARMVQLRDRLLSLFSAKALDELDGWENQDVLRREIKNEFNVLLRSSGYEGIKQIYFTEFVIQ
jgi:flagellar basal body-associated protein FliL